MNETTMERELGWEDEIENEGSPRRVLEAGEYPFTVESFERARYAGSEKVPPCPQAIVHLRIDTPEGPANIKPAAAHEDGMEAVPVFHLSRPAPARRKAAHELAGGNWTHRTLQGDQAYLQGSQRCRS